jgi:SpoIIAA-like
MIEVDSPSEDRIVTIRFRGSVTNREFIEFAPILADCKVMGGLLTYFDWQRIDSWKFTAPKAIDTIAWRNAGKIIKRTAIVHQPRLNRQAAWLAAVLRQEGVEVRSWRPQNGAAAAAWLRRST